MNYPLRDGIDDESYEAIFKPVSKQRLDFDVWVVVISLMERRILRVDVVVCADHGQGDGDVPTQCSGSAVWS